MAKKSKPGKIHLRIVEVMKRYPDGITGGQIRQELGLRPEDQTHLDKRKRELKNWFLIGKRKSAPLVEGKKRTLTLYTYEGVRETITDEGSVSERLRAEIIGAARGRCQMCGKTIEKHGITLVVDHKRPRDWGGTNDPQNLWAICEECNGGKKAYFSSLNADPEVMKKAISHLSVHVRIGELLKAVGIGNRTPSELLEIVADQDDWQKRLRELRYPVIGWKIEKKLYTASGKKKADYILRSYEEWPEDVSGTIRRFEELRKRKNRTQRKTS